MFISNTAIKQPVLVTMIMLLAITLGLLAYRTMPVNLLPDIDVPVSVVTVTYPGAGPESVADQVAKPLEDELSTLNGVSKITSTSSDGVATVVVEFKQEVDPVQGLQDVREKVNLIRGQLPDDIDDPIFQRFDPGQSPILTLAITSKSGMDGQALRTLVDDNILPRLQQVSGVGSTTLVGGRERQINVQLDLTRLQSFRLLPAQISDAIDNANVTRGLGNVNINGTDVNLRSPSAIQKPADILAIGIPGTRFKISDVAIVDDSYAEVKTFARLNGNDALTLDVRKQSGTNTVAVGEGVKEELDTIFKTYPDLSYTLVRDDSEEVRANVTGAIEEIFFAVIFALLVVMFFFSGLRITLLSAALPLLIIIPGITIFHDYVNPLYVLGGGAILLILITYFTSRNTAVTMLGLPIIIIATFAAISAFGLTINILTLLALSVSVGLVIDDAIVVRENIFRWMERGLPPKVASSRGTGEVALSVLAMTLTIIAVFVPAAFTTGVTGIIFYSFAITVACAMALSLVEAFTLAPMVSAYLFKQKKLTPEQQAELDAREASRDPNVPEEDHHEIGAMERAYQRVLNVALRYRLITVGLTIGVLLLSFVPLYLGLVKFAFFPSQEEHQFGVGFELPPGTPLDVTDKLAREAEQLILAESGVEAVITTVGGGGGGGNGGGGGGSSSEQAEFFVKLDKQTATLDAQARLREKMTVDKFPQVNFGLPSFNGASTDVTNRPIQALVQSNKSLAEIAPTIDQLVAVVQDVPGLKDIDTTFTAGKPELKVQIQPSRANEFGISNNDIARTLRALVDGDRAAVYRENGKDYDIVVRLRADDRQNVDGLRNLSIPVGAKTVPLSSIASVSLGTSPTSIRRSGRQTEVVIGGNNVDRNIGEVQADMQAKLNTVALPEGTVVSFGGNTADQAEGFASLLIAMGLSVLFVYMVLASQFGSFLQPLVIMLAMPLCFIGAFIALSVSRVELTIFGLIGMVMLLGLATKNSILLVDFTNQLSKTGMEKHKAISTASAVRLRPILMTSAAIILGSLPAAIGFGEGGGTRRALAVVLIGGMITSTLLTLVVVPVAYSLLESVVRRSSTLFRRRDRATVAPTPLAVPVLQAANGASIVVANGSPAGGNGHGQVVHGAVNGHDGVSNGVSNGGNGANGHDGVVRGEGEDVAKREGTR